MISLKKRIIRLLSIALFFIFTLSPFVTACSSVPNYSVPLGTILPESTDLIPSEIKWEQIQPGFEKITHKVKTLKVTWTCVKIDLNTENLEFILEPLSPSEEYKVESVKNFAKRNNTVVAINTNPFDNVTKSNKPIGILKNEETIISDPVKRNDYAALAIYKNKENNFRAKLLCPQSDYSTTSDNLYVIGGFFQILKDFSIQTFESIRRSRTACGIDSQGRFLYLFAVTPDFSLDDQNGLTYEECAFILKMIGSCDAMQFDGGHSTGLCIYNKNVQKPLFQRKVPAFFGIKTN